MHDKKADEVEPNALEALFQPAPVDSPTIEVVCVGEARAEHVRFYLFQDVLEELAFAAAYRDQPCIAVLIGHFAMDDDGAFIEVNGFDELEYVDDVSELYPVFKEAVERRMRSAARDDAESGRYLVGMFVAGAGRADFAGGGRLDREVARVHLSLFNMPYQLALVMDPDARKFGLYSRAPRSAFYNAPFYVVRGREQPGEEASHEGGPGDVSADDPSANE